MDAENQSSFFDDLVLTSSIAQEAMKGVEQRRNARTAKWAIAVVACIAIVLIANSVYNANVMPSVLAGRSFLGTETRSDIAASYATSLRFSDGGDTADKSSRHNAPGGKTYTSSYTCSYSSFFGIGDCRVMLTWQDKYGAGDVTTYSITVNESGMLILTNVENGDSLMSTTKAS